MYTYITYIHNIYIYIYSGGSRAGPPELLGDQDGLYVCYIYIYIYIFIYLFINLSMPARGQRRRTSHSNNGNNSNNNNDNNNNNITYSLLLYQLLLYAILYVYIYIYIYISLCRRSTLSRLEREHGFIFRRGRFSLTVRKYLKHVYIYI